MINAKNLENDLPNHCKPIIVENVLVATSKITEKFYPSAVNDYFDDSVNEISETVFKDKVNENAESNIKYLIILCI